MSGHEVTTGRRWGRSEVNEALAVLYLRLAGYFTTGLLVHAPEWGQNRTEVDCLAIRHPYHEQPERRVSPPPFLAVRRGEVDLLLCEVKSVASELTFNERLRNDREALGSVLRWAGVFSDSPASEIVDRLLPLLQQGVPVQNARDGVAEAGVRVRGLLCCPPCEETDAPGIWCLFGSEILRFAHECFNPPEPRTESSTRYNFRQWGWLSPIVEYIKDCGAQNHVALDGLYEHLGAG